MNYPKTAQVLFEEAERMHLLPMWLTDYGLFSIEVGEKKGYVFYARNMMNSNLSGFLAMDKHATRIVLQQQGFPNIPFGMFANKEAVVPFLREHKKIIAKPILGSSSKDIFVITKPEAIPALPFETSLF